MDAIPVINDMVGGVTVTMEEDLTPLNPEYVKGKTVTLHGQDALDFIRARMSVSDGTNVSRMSRQKQYIYGFAKAEREAYSNNPELFTQAIDKLNKYLLTDMTAQKMNEIAEKLSAYELKPMVEIEGEFKEGEFMEFYPDYDSMWDAVKLCFCK